MVHPVLLSLNQPRFQFVLASDRMNPGLKASKFAPVFRGINPPAPSGTIICDWGISPVIMKFEANGETDRVPAEAAFRKLRRVIREDGGKLAPSVSIGQIQYLDALVPEPNIATA